MTEAEIQAASKFWSTGPGKAVMEKWPVEWENRDDELQLRLAWNPKFGYFQCYGLPLGEPKEKWGTGQSRDDREAIHHIHGHYLDMLREKLGFYGLSSPLPDDTDRHAGWDFKGGDFVGDGDCIWRTRATLHELLAAAMEAAFGEPT